MTDNSKNKNALSLAQQTIYRKVKELEERLIMVEQLLQPISMIINPIGKKKFFRSIYSFFSVIGLFSSLMIPLITGYLSFANYITVPSPHSLKANDPLYVPFILQNNSLFNLKAVKLTASWLNVVGDTEKIKNITLKNCTLKQKYFEELNANKSITIFFPSDFVGTGKLIYIKEADIKMTITYKLLFFPWENSESFRFKSFPREDGLYEFLPFSSGNSN
jgi:hypothetical protein